MPNKLRDSLPALLNHLPWGSNWLGQGVSFYIGTRFLQVGFCCGYLIFITENLSDFIPSVPKSEWLVLILPPLFFLTLIPDLSRLAVFSLLAQVSNLLAFAVVYWFDFEHLHLAQAATRKEVSVHFVATKWNGRTSRVFTTYTKQSKYRGFCYEL